MSGKDALTVLIDFCGDRPLRLAAIEEYERLKALEGIVRGALAGDVVDLTTVRGILNGEVKVNENYDEAGQGPG